MIPRILKVLLLILFKFVEAFCKLYTIQNYRKKPNKCPPITDEILLYPASVLAQKIRNREIKCQTIIYAYISRIRKINPILNAVVENRFEEAMVEAKGTDEMLENTKLNEKDIETMFPLLGLPLTVKESVALQGMSHCAGSLFPKLRRATADSKAVKLCKEAGAIPLLVSNTPELCMNFETSNNITGTTCNPYDTRRTPGGSSGGEAALLASGASLLSIGSDLCGSIRLPAHFCGVWGHKPSPNVVSNIGHYPDCKNKEIWKQILHIGPMTRYASDIPLILKVILKKSAIPLLKLDSRVTVENIKIFYMENDGGSILTHPVNKDIVKAIRRLVEHLSEKCKVQELHLKYFRLSPEISFIKIFSIEDIDNPFGNKGKGAFSELLKYLIGKSNFVIAPIFYGILKQFSLMFLQNSTVTKCNEKLQELKRELTEILGSDGVLLYATHPTVAGFHKQVYGNVADYSYTGIFSCLGFPVTNCPLGLSSDGLPIGVQVVATTNNDRLTLTVAQEIEREFKGWISPSQ